MKIKITEKNFPYLVYAAGLCIAILGMMLLGIWKIHDIVKNNVERVKEERIRATWEDRCKDITHWLLADGDGNFNCRTSVEMNARFEEMFAGDLEEKAKNALDEYDFKYTRENLINLIILIEHPELCRIGDDEKLICEKIRLYLEKPVKQIKHSIIEYHVDKGE